MSALVVVAHPDDEVLGCGGTIAKLANAGTEIYLTILGEGITSRYENPQDADLSELNALREYSLKAAELLGIKEIFRHNFPDNRFDAINLLDLVKVVENLIVKLKPRLIYTHCQADLNIDHLLTHRAVLTATRPFGDQPVKEIYAFEVPSSTEWSFGQFHSTFQPNTFVNISETLETKINALQMYESEIESFPHPRSVDAIRAYAQRWGSAAGLQAAEAFQLVRRVIE